MGDGVDGIGNWWADALALEASEQAALSTPEMLARQAARNRAQITAFRTNREPLPSKARWEARKQVGLLLHEYDSKLCGICRTPIDVDLVNPHPGSLQLDHIHPRAGFGTDTWDNIQIAHAACNVLKRDFLEGYPTAEIAAKQLHIAIAHWEDSDQLRRDVEAVHQRVREQAEAIRSVNAEVDGLPRDDPRRQTYRDEMFPVGVAMLHDERLLSLYRRRLLAHEGGNRRSSKESPGQ